MIVLVGNKLRINADVSFSFTVGDLAVLSVLFLELCDALFVELPPDCWLPLEFPESGLSTTSTFGGGGVRSLFGTLCMQPGGGCLQVDE